LRVRGKQRITATLKPFQKPDPAMLRPLFLKTGGRSMAWTLQSLSKEARRKRVGVADVIHEAVELFVAKCEAEADLERKVIKFPMPLKTDSAMDH
jgi:hypothetical protein